MIARKPDTTNRQFISTMEPGTVFMYEGNMYMKIHPVYVVNRQEPVVQSVVKKDVINLSTASVIFFTGEHASGIVIPRGEELVVS